MQMSRRTGAGQLNTVTLQGTEPIVIESDILLIFSPSNSGFGHDKSQAILPYRRLPNPPTIFFFGDGVSGQSRQ